MNNGELIMTTDKDVFILDKASTFNINYFISTLLWFIYYLRRSEGSKVNEFIITWEGEKE